MPILAQPARLVSWNPAVDIYRTPDGWVLKLELAGVEPDDVTIHFDGSTLAISGVRRDYSAEKDWRQYSMEIVYSRFEKIIKLPCRLEAARISSECRQGMYLIHVSCAKGSL